MLFVGLLESCGLLARSRCLQTQIIAAHHQAAPAFARAAARTQRALRTHLLGEAKFDPMIAAILLAVKTSCLSTLPAWTCCHTLLQVNVEIAVGQPIGHP